MMIDRRAALVGLVGVFGANLFAPLARPPRCLATALATHKHAHGIATPAASTTSLAPQHQQTRVYRQRRRRRWAAA